MLHFNARSLQNNIPPFKSVFIIVNGKLKEGRGEQFLPLLSLGILILENAIWGEIKIKSWAQSKMVTGWNLWDLNTPGTVSVSPQAPVVSMGGWSLGLHLESTRSDLNLQHKSTGLYPWVQLLKKNLYHIFCTEQRRYCLTKERNGSLWFMKFPPSSVCLDHDNGLIYLVTWFTAPGSRTSTFHAFLPCR